MTDLDDAPPSHLAAPAGDAAPTDSPAGPRRGLLVIQLDGVSSDVLRSALRRGPMPSLGRLLERSHQLLDWRVGPPAMTSSSQAAILYGDDFDIPAFRWYEKEHGRLMVSNHPADAAIIDARRSGGLLADHGSSVGNIVSGGAPQSVLTMGTIASGAGAVTVYRWLLDPRFIVAELFLMIREVLVEVGQATRQRMRLVRPRVKRGGSVPFLRAISNVLLRDLTTKVVMSELRTGVPVIYANYVGYDVVAHHAGPTRPDSIKVLARLDREIATLLRGAREAPRTYDVVVLSDHGQSTGAPFRARFGRPLEEVVRELASDMSVSSAGGTTETWGHLNELLSATVVGQRRAARRARLALRPRLRDGYVEIGPDRMSARPGPADIVVCASGNLAHVYLATVPGRVPLDRIRELHPGLVEGLVDHPGIAFVLAQTESGPVVITRRGSSSLADGTVVGDDPSPILGRRAVDALRRLAEFPHTGDLVLNGRIDRDGSVAAFEDLVGSHGGLGGDQTRPFLVVPGAWGVEEAPADGRAVHDLLAAHLPSVEEEVRS